jgi:hypothetical protein
MQWFLAVWNSALRKVREKWTQVSVQRTDANLGHRALASIQTHIHRKFFFEMPLQENVFGDSHQSRCLL